MELNYNRQCHLKFIDLANKKIHKNNLKKHRSCENREIKNSPLLLIYE
jgi:hypothetical protein